MRFAIGKLLFTEALILLQQLNFIINLHFIQSIKQLDDFERFGRGISLHIKLKIPFL
jgi:hypothetical protein